jgi:hypothetical protein
MLPARIKKHGTAYFPCRVNFNMEERMKKAIVIGLFFLGISFFCGYVIIAVGIGSVYPPLYKVSTPIVCRSNQQLEVVQKRYSWRPGEAMWTATIYCVGPETNQKENCTGLAKLVAGAIYGLGIFVLCLPLIWRAATRPIAERAASAPATERATAQGSAPARTIDEKLVGLKRLLDSNLITAEEYEQKKAEILKEI